MPKSHLQTLNSSDGTDFARALRVHSTDAERLVWSKLRNRQVDGWKFRRQVPMGRYIVDFLCEDARLIVELDGGQHGEALNYDEARTKWLNGNGYQVVRFWNNDVMNNIDGVLQSLTLTLSQGRGDLKSEPSAQAIAIPSPLGQGNAWSEAEGQGEG